jgi:hypothetical protein
MKEYLLILKTEGSVWTDLSPDQLQQHLKNGGAYIGRLLQEGKLKSANPVEKGGRTVSGPAGALKDGPFNETKELLAGYFVIAAENLDEAVAIAKANPIFGDIPTTIEVHPLMAIQPPN